MNINPSEAEQALAAMRASQAKVTADNCPSWTHPLAATLLSGVVAAQAAPTQVFFGLVILVLVGLGAVYVITKARKGVFINGWRAGATRPVAITIFAVYMAIYTTTWFLKIERGLWQAPLIGAAILFPIAWYLSRRWLKLYRTEIGA